MKYRRLLFLSTMLIIFLSSCSNTIYQSVSLKHSNEGILGVEITGGMVMDGDDLYFIREGGLSKVNTSAPIPMLIDVYDSKDLNDVFALLHVDDYLYYALYEKGVVYRIDLKSFTKKPIKIASGLIGPDAMCVRGKELFIAEFKGNRISKIDLTKPGFTPITVVENVESPSAVVVKDDFLFVSQYTNNKVSKIDITKKSTELIDVVVGLDRPDDMLIIGEDLYVSEYFGDKITKVNTLNSKKESLAVITDLHTPSEMTMNGKELFISCEEGSMIYRYDFKNSKRVSLNEREGDRNIVLNSSSDD